MSDNSDRENNSVCAVENVNQNALFAIPKKGRLYDKCIKLLSGAGLELVSYILFVIVVIILKLYIYYILYHKLSIKGYECCKYILF